MDYETATATTFKIALSELEVFLADSDKRYLYSATSGSGSLKKHHSSVAQFHEGNNPEALTVKASTPRKFLASDGRIITAYPAQVITAYWRYWDKRGDVLASSLVDALLGESLDRYADEAFSRVKSHAEYKKKTEVWRINYIKRWFEAKVRLQIEAYDVDNEQEFWALKIIADPHNCEHIPEAKQHLLTQDEADFGYKIFNEFTAEVRRRENEMPLGKYMSKKAQLQLSAALLEKHLTAI